MDDDGISKPTSLSLVLALFLLTFAFQHPSTALAHAPYELHQLEISEVKMYDHESTNLEDYHPNQEPIREAHSGQGFVTNALVSNYNHTQEHFDYITEIFDNDGKTVYLHVRYGVAVNLGGKIPIDSSTAPIILEPGIYLVKVFTWRNADDLPIALSHGAVGVVMVA